jgi:hypothetical protein
VFLISLLLCANSARILADEGEKLATLGIADPGKPVELLLLSNAEQETLVGPTNRMQLLVSASYDSGQTRDWTSRVRYAVEPAGIVEVQQDGLVTPLADGSAVIHVSADGLSAKMPIAVERFANPPQVNFGNEIVPIFTKMSCNSGGCHGKSGGQNGFALSLLGFEPQQDYSYIVKEARGRRVFPAAPEKSLLLAKATGFVPHGGGARIHTDSDEYRLLRLWIEQGMPYGQPEDPTLVSVEVLPKSRTMELTGQQQLKVIAHYSDGAQRDVTRQARYTANNTDMAEVSEMGRVSLTGSPGVVAVMVRYQGQVDAFLASIPLGAPVNQLPAEVNLVDKHVFAKLRELGLPPSDVCDDSTFLRRVTIDICGRLPTLAETTAFLEDGQGDKRAKLIERLLASDDYASYFAQKWTAILRNKATQNQPREGNFLFHDWVRRSLADNLPYDQFVTQLITASGDVRINPAVNWHLKLGDVDQRVEDTAQVFLGQRIQCAKCHHHPYEKWGQDDYWGLAAFYTNLKQKRNGQIVSERRVAQARNPNSQKMIVPTGLDSQPLELAVEVDPRLKLAAWMTAPENPFFARSLANRYWKHFMGRGIVEPEDDMRATNPPSNPQLLDALAADFVAAGFDLKHLVRTICNSSTYQLSSVPNDYNQKDTQSFSKFSPRRLPAEVMLNGLDQFLGSETSFQNLPKGTRATEIPDHGAVVNLFLDTFGRPEGSSACECERDGEMSMAQCLHLLNSDEMYNKLQSGRSNQFAMIQPPEAGQTVDVPAEDAVKIEEIYLRAFSRPPTQSEVETMQSFLQRAEPANRKAAFEDILWTITNTKEFMFNH